MNPQLRPFVENFLKQKFRSRHDLQFDITRVPESRSEVYEVSAAMGGTQHSWIAKLTTRGEIIALRLLADAGIANVPTVLAEDRLSDHQYLLMPKYPGVHGDFGDPVPEKILHTLAQIHYRFLDRQVDLKPTDRDSLSRLFQYTFADAGSYPVNCRKKIEQIREAVETFATIATGLPQTLVHWDVHPGNILADGKDAWIIDWESARLGPGLIDLANLVKWDTPDFQTYIAAYESFSGKPFNHERKLVEYKWCRAITQVKYVPFAAKFLKPAQTESMVDSVIDYLDELKTWA